MTANLLLDGSPWAFALAAEPDVEACRSTYVGHPLAREGTHLACLVNHAETGEALHGVGPVRWSDEDAAAALLAEGWTCLYCQAACLPHLFRGCCTQRCAYLEHDADDEMEMEAA